ncbi:hypothetical protein Ctob_003964, partial [Chrysochromulina tobinii]
MCRLAVQNRTAQTNARARQLESGGVESWTSPSKRTHPAKGATDEGIEIGGTIVVDPEDVLTPRKKVMLVELHQSPKAKTIRFQTLNTGFSTAVVLLVRAVGETGVALEPTIVKIDVRKELESEIQLHEQMQKHLGFNMPQLLAVTDSAERELIGYKQSFAGACWQMPELASVGGDLAVPLERLIRQELIRDAVDGISSFSLGDVSVSRVLETLMGDIVLQLCKRTASRCDAPLLEPILGPKTRDHVETMRDMTTGSDRATFEELLALLDNKSSRLPFESGHEPIRAMCHGDLHGGNVMIDSRGNPWLIDCGMSKPADKGYPLMDAAKLECCFLFAYVLAPLTVDHIKGAEPNELVDWLSLGRKDVAHLQTIAAGCATKQELLDKLASESMLAQVKVRLEEPDLCEEWLKMAAGRLDELMNVDELTACMRRTDYMNPARRRPPGLATQGDRLSKYRKSLDVADGFAGKIRRYISALSTCLKADDKARGSLDSHVLNLAMHLLFYSIRFTLRGYPTSSPMHKRLAQHVSARLARVVLDAVRAQSSEARPAVATIVQPASYVQYEHGQVLQLQPHDQPDARGCSVVVVRDQGSVCLLAANHSPCVDHNMDHAIDFCSYQALVRTALGTIIDVLSAQRLDLMLQCVNLKVKGNNADAFTTIMEEVKVHAPKGQPPAILIRAEAAGGKTTFSKRFVLLCTIEQWGRHVAAPTPDPVFYVPVLVFVVDLVKVLKKQRGADGGNLLLIHLQSHLGAHTRHYAFVLQAWLDGRLIVILDGWDECDRLCKDEMQRYITTMLLGRVSLVITSRPAAVDGDAFFGEAFQRFELAGLDGPMQDHVAKYRLPVTKLPAYKRTLHQSVGLTELCRNPLLLSMLLTVIDTREDNASQRELNRFALYNTIVTALVERLEKKALGAHDGAHDDVAAAEGSLMEFTCHLAHATHSLSTGSKKVNDEVRGRVRLAGAAKTWEGVHMSILQGRFPILQLQEQEAMFAHLSLQESLTFMAAARYPEACPVRLDDVLKEHRWWLEVVRFAAECAAEEPEYTRAFADNLLRGQAEHRINVADASMYQIFAPLGTVLQMASGAPRLRLTISHKLGKVDASAFAALLPSLARMLSALELLGQAFDDDDWGVIAGHVRGMEALETLSLNGSVVSPEVRADLVQSVPTLAAHLRHLDLGGLEVGADEALALVSTCRALQTLRLGEWAVPVGELRSGGEAVSTGGQAVGEAEGAVVGALLRASTSLTTLDLSRSWCAAEAARLIGEGLRESAAPLAELRLANVWYTTDGRMPAAAVWERQAALVSGACRLSLREVECSAQAIEATETAALQRGLLLFAPELKVASATLGDGGRSVRLADANGRALLGAVSPMVELVVQQCTDPAGCRIGATLPGKGALFSSLGTDAESWGYLADGKIRRNGSDVQSGLPTYKAGDRIRMTLAGGVLAWHINGQRAAEVRGVPTGVHLGVGRFNGTVETLRLGEWAVPVGELRSGGEAVSTGGLAVGEAEGAVVGALLKASTSLTTLDLSGSSCAAAALARLSEGLKASAAPLAELRLGGLIHGEGAASVAARLAALVRGACRPSLRLIDCTKQAGGKAGVCALFAAEGEGVVASLAALMSTAGNALTTVQLGGNGAWAEGDGATLAAALGAASCVVAELDVGGCGLSADEALALVAAGRALQTLRLGEWAVPVGELRSGGEAVSTGGLAVGEAEGAVVGALLRASTSLTTLDLSGSSCAAAALARLSEGLKARAGGKAGVCALFAAEGEGVVSSLATLMSTAGNALTTVQLGGNGAWAEGDGRRAFASALGAASCVVAELDVSGSGLGADEALALVAAGRALQTLRLGEWAVPVGELRSGGEAVSTCGQAVGEAEGAVVGALLRASTSLTTLDLSGSRCVPATLARLSEGLKASAVPLAELRLGGLRPGSDGSVCGAEVRADLVQSVLTLAANLRHLDLGGLEVSADEALALVSTCRALQTLRLGEWAVPVGELRSGGEALSLIGQAVGEADGAVVGALLRASTSLTTLDLSGSSCAAEAARLIGEGLRESAAPLAELRLANVWYTTDGRMPAAAVWEQQAALVSGACRQSLRAVECSAQAIGATETAALQRCLMLFAPELKVASATLGDGGRSVRLADDYGRALLGAVSPMVELVVQQCSNPGGCIIGAAPPGKAALSSSLGADAESWGYFGDGRIFNKGSAVQSGLPTYKAGDRIRMTLAGGVLAWHINGQRAAE